MIELYILEQLAAFAQYGTLLKVSEELHISQPALSRSMQKAEAELGVCIFERSKNRLALNKLGILAAEQARAIVEAEKELRRSVRDADRRRSIISLGSIAPMPVFEASPILSQLYMDMTITSDLKDREEDLIEGLENGTYDLIVLRYPLESERYYSRRFFNERLSILLPITHDLANRPSLCLQDLSEEHILIYTRLGFWYGVCLEKIPNVHFLDQNDMQALRTIAQQSELPSFVTNMSNYADSSLSNKVAIPLTDPEVNVSFYCVCLKKDLLRFWDFFSAVDAYSASHPD